MLRSVPTCVNRQKQLAQGKYVRVPCGRFLEVRELCHCEFHILAGSRRDPDGQDMRDEEVGLGLSAGPGSPDDVDGAPELVGEGLMPVGQVCGLGGQGMGGDLLDQRVKGNTTCDVGAVGVRGVEQSVGVESVDRGFDDSGVGGSAGYFLDEGGCDEGGRGGRRCHEGKQTEHRPGEMVPVALELGE